MGKQVALLATGIILGLFVQPFIAKVANPLLNPLKLSF